MFILGMTSDIREVCIELYKKLKDDDRTMKRVQMMISYREKKLAPVLMKMEEKFQFMKDTNVISLVKFMRNILKKKLIVDFDLKMLQ